MKKGRHASARLSLPFKKKRSIQTETKVERPRCVFAFFRELLSKTKSSFIIFVFGEWNHG